MQVGVDANKDFSSRWYGIVRHGVEELQLTLHTYYFERDPSQNVIITTAHPAVAATS